MLIWSYVLDKNVLVFHGVHDVMYPKKVPSAFGGKQAPQHHGYLHHTYIGSNNYLIPLWRLARPLQDLNMLLFEPLLCCLGRMFRVIVMFEDPSTTHFQCSHWGKEIVAQNFPVHGPIHPPLDTVKSPLSRETPPKHKVFTSMLHSGDGVLGAVVSISLPPNMASRVNAK